MAQMTHLPALPGVRPVPARIYIYGAGENGTQKLPKRDKTGIRVVKDLRRCRRAMQAASVVNFSGAFQRNDAIQERRKRQPGRETERRS